MCDRHVGPDYRTRTKVLTEQQRDAASVVLAKPLRVFGLINYRETVKVDLIEVAASRRHPEHADLRFELVSFLGCALERAALLAVQHRSFFSSSGVAPPVVVTRSGRRDGLFDSERDESNNDDAGDEARRAAARRNH
jgi:hypothetical protein